jgi:hypothetical protein
MYTMLVRGVIIVWLKGRKYDAIGFIKLKA